jgi:hypothetical protein
LPAQVGDAVPEHGDRLRATDRIDLIDAEDLAERQDAGMWQSAKLNLRR